MEHSARSYKDLIVWQKSLTLCRLIYECTEKYPQRELYGLASQMRRAAVSIPSNIAEGRSRSTAKDFGNFLRIALGSAAELETQLLISKDLSYCDNDMFEKADSLLSEIRRMLHAMIKGLEASD